MKIETKYDIGQEVWAFDLFDRPQKGEIQSIGTLNCKVKEHDYVSYYIHGIGSRKEQEVYPTKEELIKKSLKYEKERT